MMTILSPWMQSRSRLIPTSAVEAVKIIAQFFELDIDWEDSIMGDVATMAQLLKDAANRPVLKRKLGE